MSLAEIKAELETMPLEERLSLAEYLHVLNRIDDPQVQREVNEAMARMDAGETYTLNDLDALDAKRAAGGG